jgi:hypothetical protein
MTDNDEKLKIALKSDYALIPMKDITDEARLIAVAWMECEDKRWIGNKHKLASDIMNYARRNSPSIEELAQKLREANPYEEYYEYPFTAWNECVDKLLELSKQQTNG